MLNDNLPWQSIDIGNLTCFSVPITSTLLSFVRILIAVNFAHCFNLKQAQAKMFEFRSPHLYLYFSSRLTFFLGSRRSTTAPLALIFGSVVKSFCCLSSDTEVLYTQVTTPAALKSSVSTRLRPVGQGRRFTQIKYESRALAITSLLSARNTCPQQIGIKPSRT